jgi:alkylation response protein AidB-like acyl-CoA dehydrogenase
MAGYRASRARRSGAIMSEPAGIIAPDTTGLNFFRADPSLADLLRIYLSPGLYRHIEPHLDRLGALAGGPCDEWARLADRHPPVLHHRDRFGRDEQWIEYHPAYRELERVAYGEFGIHAMSHRPGILGWPETYPAVAKHAFTYLFNQAEYGLGCPINVTDGAAMLLARFGDAALKAKYLDGLTTTDMALLTQGAQFMTEKEGGSDVGRLATRAVRDGDHWRLHGEKWFCSNADAAIAMVLARPEGAPSGTRGLGLFLVPRRLDDGSPNRYRIVRLKEKLGTRSMASGEITFEGAAAYLVGRVDRGFAQMAEMVNWSRLSNGVKSTALIRRALHDAFAVARGRIAFGRPVIALPLARRQLVKMLLPLEQALSMCFATADALDRAEAGSQEAALLLRLLTPVLKFRATRDARRVCGDALEMRGGVGYIEEFAPARLLRDAHLGSIWEGTGNIVALDALTRAIGRHGADAVLAAMLRERLEEARSIPAGFRACLQRLVDRAIALAQGVARDPGREAEARRVTSSLYHAASAVSLAWEAHRLHDERGDARRLLLSGLVVAHRLAAQDPLGAEAGDARLGDRLLDETPVPMAEAAALVASFGG